jgi:protein O-mannosyl-transferase
MSYKINISPGRQKLIVYIVLAIVTFAVYWQVNQFDLINFDDDVYITQNSHIRSGIASREIRWAFGTKPLGLWNPLVWISFMFDYQLYGLNAGGYHLTNVILHILSALLLFHLLTRMTGAIWKSAFVAAVFALHPLHVESVAWVAERKDVLSAFFWMLTLCLYAYYTEKPSAGKYLFVLVCFVLALLSKPMVVTLPVMMILLDYWPLKRFASHKGNLLLWQLKEKLPFFILSAVLIVVTLYNPSARSGKLIPFGLRIANAPVSFLTYLEKTFWPRDMAIFYPFPAQIPAGYALGALLLIIIISVVVIAAAKRLPYLFTGWLWYAITIAPVIGIIQIATDPEAMADRYTYLPSIGIGIMLAWGVPHLFPGEGARRKILFPAGIVVAAILAVISWQQCGYWKNSAAVFSHALRVTKDNYLAHNNLAAAMNKEDQIKDAVNHYNEAILIKPDYANAYCNRGLAYAKLNKYESAIEDYSKFISLNRNFANVYYNRGLAYAKLIKHQLAIEDYSKFISLNRNFAIVFNKRGDAYYELGRYQKAIEDYDAAIHVKPDYLAAYNKRGDAYYKLGRYRKAIGDYDAAIRLNPDDLAAYNNRGNAYSELGLQQKAIENYKTAIRLKPDDFHPYYNMACCLAIQKKAEQACSFLTQASEQGFRNWTQLKKDKDFDNIRNAECFISLLDKAGK